VKLSLLKKFHLKENIASHCQPPWPDPIYWPLISAISLKNPHALGRSDFAPDRSARWDLNTASHLGRSISSPPIKKYVNPAHGDWNPLLQLLLDCAGYFLGIGSDGWFKSLHHAAVSINQKFGEVPFDVPANARESLLGEVGIKRCLVIAFHRNLGVHRECHIVFARAEGLDLFVCAGLLRSEIVSREAKNDESFIFVLLVD
jgi:hypothetical protein